MSIGPLGFIGAAAGSPLAQQKGSDTERAAQDQNTQARETDAAKQSAKAEGVGEMDQDHETSDRDADGRRAWERPQSSHDESSDESENPENKSSSRDATGQRGNHLDLSG